VQTLRLFIADELHLIGGVSGPTLEVIVSRTRYIASQTGNHTRLLGLASSLANARDVGEWIGAPSSSIFNFHPNVRPIPLEVHIQGFDQVDVGARLMAMSRPTLNAVAHLGQGQPVLIFVPTRKQARAVARDLITFSDPADPNKTFLHLPAEELAAHLEKVENKALKEAIGFGVGLYHEGLSERERRVAELLFRAGAIQVLVATGDLCWNLSVNAAVVVIQGTQKYDGKEQRYVDYPVADLLQMIGRAGRGREDAIGRVSLCCYGPRKEFYKEFLFQPLPVESHLDQMLTDHMNAEVVTKTIENKQDAVDYITWTLLYRRLTQNPNYYNLAGSSHTHLSDHLSELVETTLTELQNSKCISIEDDMDVAPLNLGMIACYYNIRHTSIDLFNESLSAQTKIKGILDILAAAAEFEHMPIRQGEHKILSRLAAHLPLKVEGTAFNHISSKVNVLLQAHFSRKPLAADLMADQNAIVETSVRLLQGMVDVISSNGWLKPALACMELSQMITQAVWDSDSHLKQLPHLTSDRIQVLKGEGVDSIYDLIDLDEKKRNKLLSLSAKQLQDVARACNRYPNIDLTYKVDNDGSVTAGTTVAVTVNLERDWESDELPPVFAPYFPKDRIEGWWLVVGDPQNNGLLSIKRFTLAKSSQIKLDFDAPAVGTHNLMLYFMCDSYAGCDQEYQFTLNVQPPTEEMQE
jgi:pre-mRNA-splicing helicase BRR2